MFVLLRRLVHSPFGLSLRGIREKRKRMPAIGASVREREIAIFTVSAAVAGIAGALLAQTTQFVALDVLGFRRSAELLIILVLGGTGRLYGGLVGAAVYMIAQDVLAGINPVYWQFWIGALLVVIVLFARGGILGGLALLRAKLRRRASMTQVLRTQGLAKHWGAFKANSDIDVVVCARRAPRADRAERRGQDHADQPADRRLSTDRGRGVPGR